ncbi:MAG: VWA domain-containing protein [Chitinivibrionales bacterium]|nr:VWA domain-containing protein [Chitinivibrionales bacterium]MBD3397409.1 VWA domain-containing protein [Chitinivibrionales bacterium]
MRNRFQGSGAGSILRRAKGLRMSTRMILRPAFRAFFAVLVVSLPAAAKSPIPEPHESDLRIAGGPVYMAWPEADSFMNCGLALVAPSQRQQRRKPLQLVVLIDVSRPMQGEPLKYAKKAIKACVEILKDGDVFGLVAFSTYARVAFPMQPLNAGIRPSARAAIDGLGDEDRRSPVAGIRKAAEQFERFKGQETIGRHLFLFTNGNANHTVTGPDKILKEIAEFSRRFDVRVSTFGFTYFERTGEPLNEDLLYAIAETTRGRYYFIDDHQDITARMTTEAVRVSDATARSVTVRIVPPGRGSRITNVDGALVDGDRILIGDMAPSETRIVVFDIEGRPTRQRDCEVVATYAEADRVGERETRIYLDIPLTGGSTRLNPSFGPRLIVYDLQMSLVETAGRIKENRHEYTQVFRDKIKDLEQENVILDSDYIRDALAYYEKFERVLANTTIEASMVVKHIKYRVQELLRGK